MNLSNVTDALVSSIIKAVVKEVLQPSNLRLIFDAWRQANEKQLIEVSGPNEYDKELQDRIIKSGMGGVHLPNDKSD